MREPITARDQGITVSGSRTIHKDGNVYSQEVSYGGLTEIDGRAYPPEAVNGRMLDYAKVLLLKLHADASKQE